MYSDEDSTASSVTTVTQEMEEWLSIRYNPFSTEWRKQVLSLFLISDTGVRKEYWLHKRINWSHHVQQLLHEGQFKTMYRMELGDFNRLVSYLRSQIEPDWGQATRRNEIPIYSELIVAAGICWLCLGSYHDI